MAEVVLNTIFQVKRGTADRWKELNPILRQGEPGFEIDKGRLKIGNGISTWKELKYINCNEFSIATDNKSIVLNKTNELELFGFASAIEGQSLRKTKDGTLEWFIPSTLEEIDSFKQLVKEIFQKEKYKITDVPAGTLIDYNDKEIRVMCPADTNWVKQNVGANGNPNMHYMTFKAYAPDNAVSFKEGDHGIIVDEMFTFDDQAAGIDEFGRKYSVVWFPLASYDESNNTWTYFGKNSTSNKYVGWTYIVEWYDENGIKINSDIIRISLSNENCHNNILPYYLGDYQKITDSIDISRLVDNEGTILIFNGGSAEDLV